MPSNTVSLSTRSLLPIVQKDIKDYKNYERGFSVKGATYQLCLLNLIQNKIKTTIPCDYNIYLFFNRLPLLWKLAVFYHNNNNDDNDDDDDDDDDNDDDDDDDDKDNNKNYMYVCVPTIIAIVERSFSMSIRVKTWLPAIMNIQI